MLNVAEARVSNAASSAKPLLTRSIATVLLLTAQLITSLLLGVALGQRLLLLAQARKGLAVAPAQFGPSDLVIITGSRLAIPLTVATAIAFLLWLYRVCENLRSYRGTTLALTPGEAVGSFFIPFINLVRPYEVLRDVWTASSSANTASSASDPSGTSGRWLVLLWWILFVARGISAWWASLIGSGVGSDLEKVTLGSYGMLVSHLLSMPAALSAIALVYLIDRRNDGPPDTHQQPSPERVRDLSEPGAL